MCRYRRCQEIDLFGELAGVSFTPDGGRLFIAVSGVFVCGVVWLDWWSGLASCG
jgi:hypothetical protein